MDWITAMSGLGYDTWVDDKQNDNAPVAISPDVDGTQDRDFNTATGLCGPDGMEERNMLRTQTAQRGKDEVGDTASANRETELSIRSNSPTTVELIGRDEVESKGSTHSSSPNSTPPPTAEHYDKWLYHTGFKEFGNDLHEAAKAVFPNIAPGRYRDVYVLMLKWEDEDPNLPVSWEITRLFNVFQNVFNFQTEVWDIKDQDCHAEVNQKILDFSRLGGNSKEDLKIVYYAGHGKLTMNRLLSWTSWRNNNKSKCPTVKWSGIQNVLEESESDVLLLLDCCHAGTANTNDGNGITELISACPYNSNANGVGPYSFTHALAIELEVLSSRAEFSTGELYANIYCRTQIRMPEDGAGTERHPPPIHLVLNNDSKYRRSIHLARRLSSEDESGAKLLSALEHHQLSVDANKTKNNSERSSTIEIDQDECNSPSFRDIQPIKQAPRLALAIRFYEDLRLEDLSADSFLEWLRTMPLVAQQVRVEAGFESFSSLLVVSIPIALFAYLSNNPAVTYLGPITSSNRVRSIQQHPKRQATALSDEEILYGTASVAQDPEEHEPIMSLLESTTTRAGDEVPTLRRRNSNTESVSSSGSTITSDGLEDWPPETNPHSPSPEIYNTVPALDDEDDWEYPASLKEFGNRLKETGSCIFPFQDEIVYSRASCLLLSWASEDTKLSEVSELADLFRISFNFEVERYLIPSQDSHSRVMAKVVQFLKDENPHHLKILYYGGGGKVFADGHSEWISNVHDAEKRRYSTVEWSYIFSKLESSTSDVLALLDCTGAGSFRSTEGSGVTELIAACAIKQSVSSVETSSFTSILIGVIQRLSRMPPFTVNYLYNCVFEKCQGFRQSHGHEIDPVHIILGQNKVRPRSIRFPTYLKPARLPLDSGGPLQLSLGSLASDDIEAGGETADDRRVVISQPSQVPALFLTIRIPELAEFEDLSTDLFREWLRELPIPTDSVMIQWGFVSS